ncbi:37S ribosomal protein S22 [Gnomoniopsis smithogilvyi]|uniref:37S ribosomal protein S22 n=1 Tax=Gnomoniopsis smithogilvyi TaxID=1191159 RepID=A0A9W9CTQ0_9PEZI|nr:37S ribosomal protein S22 [Gnomoniopsis smithogilvyi]
MLAARRLQNGCPSCTAQILRFYVNSIADIAPAAAARRTTRSFNSRPRLHGRRNDARLLSTSSRSLQDASAKDKSSNERVFQDHSERAQSLEPDHPQHGLPEELVEAFEELEILPENQDPETIVRQAKRLFGDSLPEGYLSADEYKLYERLYGAPLRTTAPEDVGFGSFGEEEIQQVKEQRLDQNALLREDAHGNLEEVEYVLEQTSQTTKRNLDGGSIPVGEESNPLDRRPPNEAQIEYIEAHANNQREYEALLRLQQDFEVARLRAAIEKQSSEEKEAQEEDMEEDEELEEEEEYEDEGAQFDVESSLNRSRLHEYTIEGKFSTKPNTLLLPREELIEPITELLRRTDTKHIKAAAEKNFGGKGLPYGPATPTFAKAMPQRGLGIGAAHHRMSEIDADAFMGTAMPGIYATAMSTLVEVRKRLGPEWVRGLLNRKDGEDVGPRVLDTGAGGAGLMAWNSLVQAEWDMMRENDVDLDALPPGRKTVIVGSNTLRHRISRFLQNTQFLPRLPSYSHIENSEKQLDAPEVQQKRKVYDVIIASHVLLPLEKEYKRREMLDNLWSLLSPDGGVLIVLEKGHPRGFEAVAEVRQRLLDEFILAPTATPRTQSTEPEDLPRVREPGMIIAPCTNHVKCPMYQTSGVSPGRKDFCHFSQRFTRPQFLQRILGETSRNYEDINFSFISVRRGLPMPTPASTTASSDATVDASSSATVQPDSTIFSPISILQGEAATNAALRGYESTPTNTTVRPHPLSLPRNILPPLKRKGHVTLDLCTPSGSIERWTVPKSFSKQAYHDARKARWGDLWALGAKTRIRRKVRLGRGYKEGEVVPNDSGVRAARAAALNGIEPTKKGRNGLGGPAGKHRKVRVVELGINEKGAFQERVKGVQGRRPERRTKGGRLPPRESNMVRLEED